MGGGHETQDEETDGDSDEEGPDCLEDFEDRGHEKHGADLFRP